MKSSSLQTLNRELQICDMINKTMEFRIPYGIHIDLLRSDDMPSTVCVFTKANLPDNNTIHISKIYVNEPVLDNLEGEASFQLNCGKYNVDVLNIVVVAVNKPERVLELGTRINYTIIHPSKFFADLTIPF